MRRKPDWEICKCSQSEHSSCSINNCWLKVKWTYQQSVDSRDGGRGTENTIKYPEWCLRTSSPRRRQAVKHGLRWDRCSFKSIQETDNTRLLFRISHFCSHSSAHSSKKCLQNLFLCQRPPFVICFPNRQYTQENIYICFSVESTYPLLKRKKKSHLGEG